MASIKQTVNNMHPKKQHILDIIGNEPKTLDELGHAMIKFLNTNKHRARFDREIYNGVGVVGLAWNVLYSDSVSNSHDCPLNGVTNWRVENDKPRGYPGFKGRIWIRYARELDTWGSDPIREYLGYPGSGGAGGYSGPWSDIAKAYYERYGHKSVGGKQRFIKPDIYSWDYRFYIDDWPELAKMVEHQRTFQLLQSQQFAIDHAFEWNDERTIARDEEMLEYIRKFPGRTKSERYRAKMEKTAMK